LESLILRNKVKESNEDVLKITEKLLGLWQKHKASHKKKGTYTNGSAKLDRKRFQRMFYYAARAEDSKIKPGKE